MSLHYENGAVTNLGGEALCHIEVDDKIVWYPEEASTVECSSHDTKSNPYRCDLCNRALAYVGAPCVNEECKNYFSGF